MKVSQKWILQWIAGFISLVTIFSTAVIAAFSLSLRKAGILSVALFRTAVI